MPGDLQLQLPLSNVLLLRVQHCLQVDEEPEHSPMPPAGPAIPHDGRPVDSLRSTREGLHQSRLGERLREGQGDVHPSSAEGDRDRTEVGRRID